jgi:CheY-like chemotaxis protein
VKADPGQIEQVILNLAVNARDAMPGGGKLILETANVALDEHYVRGKPGLAPGPYVQFAVSDTGSGIDAETRARIFEPFFTTKELGKGTGLGLSTVHGIVAQSGGCIEVYSTPGRGTTFKVYLPRVDEALTPAGARDEGELSVDGSERILIVEDDEMVRAVVRETLAGHGYTIVEASDGAQALQACGPHEVDFDLVLSDVMLPVLSGPELGRRLRLLDADLRLLFVSGYTDRAIVHQGLLAPDTAFLQKPFTPAALLRKVREVLDEPRSRAA